jgi:hypothetical protein
VGKRRRREREKRTEKEKIEGAAMEKRNVWMVEDKTLEMRTENRRGKRRK